MGQQPTQFGQPSKAGSKPSRTTLSGKNGLKVDLTASTDTQIRLAIFPFGSSGRAN
jgi:hypothetical protein